MRAFLKRLDWFAIASVLFLAVALYLATQQPPTLDTLEFIVASGFASIVSAAFSVRSAVIELLTLPQE